MARTPRRAPAGGRRGLEFSAVVAVVGAVLLLQVAASSFAGAAALRDADTATGDIFVFTADVTAERILDFLDPAIEASWSAESAILNAGPLDFFGADPFADLEDPLAALEDPIFDEDGFLFGDVDPLVATVDTLAIEDFRAAMANDVQLSGILVAFADGTVYGVSRGPTGWTEVTGRPGTAEPYLSVFHGVAGAPAEPEVWERGHPYIKTSWFAAGAAAVEPTWFGLTPSEIGVQPVLSVVTGVRGWDGELIAVVRVELENLILSEFLTALPIGEDGEAFLLSEERGVIAAPEQYNADLAALRIDAAGPELQGDGPGVDTEGGQPSGPPDGPVNSGHDATELGIEVPDADSIDRVHEQGDYLVFETPLSEDGNPNWSVHLRASAGGIAPGIASFERTMLTYSIVIGAVVVLGALLVMLLRGPLQRLRERAAHDTLTGLVNRGEFMARGSEMLEAAERRGGTVAVAMFDLDNFKRVNDTLGHDAGDDALVVTARALERGSGPRDVVGRFGGDEFVIAHWIADGENAVGAIERIRAHVMTELRSGRLHDSDVGVSAGFSSSGAGVNDLGALISAADEALVAGKAEAKGTTYAAR